MIKIRRKGMKSISNLKIPKHKLIAVIKQRFKLNTPANT